MAGTLCDPTVAAVLQRIGGHNEFVPSLNSLLCWEDEKPTQRKACPEPSARAQAEGLSKGLTHGSQGAGA